MTTLLELMDRSGMNKNQISKISGISNTYLSKIEQLEAHGSNIKIKRKTLINIAVSLNLSIVEISNLLKEYDHGELSTADVPYFLSASENQTVTGILPVFSSLVKGWFLMGIEKRLSVTDGASLEYVLDQPSHHLRSPGHASFRDEADFIDETIHPLHKDLTESAVIHRRRLINGALERGNHIRTYICANCFEKYTLSWEKFKGTPIEGKYKFFLKEHLTTLVRYLEMYPNNYQYYLLKKCPRTRYELVYLPDKNAHGDVESKVNTVIFLGRESPCNVDRKILWRNEDHRYSQGFGDLSGFATDLQNLVEFFHKQHLGLVEHFIDKRFDSPDKMTNHIKELITNNIDNKS